MLLHNLADLVDIDLRFVILYFHIGQLVAALSKDSQKALFSLLFLKRP